MEEQSFRGVWWSPEHSDVQIDHETDLSTIPDGATAGIVKYDPSSPIEIELIGELGRPDEISELSVIHGVTTDGDKITISDCLWEEKNEREGSGYFVTENWIGHNIFRHEHTQDTEFESILVQFPNAEHWTNIGSLEPDDDADQYDFRKEVRVADLDDFSLKFIMTERPSPHGSSTYPDSALFEFEFSSPKDYSSISSEYIRPLRNFLSLAMNEPIFPEEISDGEIRNKTEIYPYNGHYSDVEDIYPSSMFFTLDEIDFGEAISSWFADYNELRTLHNLYFSTLYSDGIFLELEFLSLVIGLETYHRRAFPDDYHMDEQPFEAYRDAAEERLPEVAAKDRTMDLLRSIGNDYSLQERLESVVSEIRPILKELMDVEETLKQAKNFRHNLAHGLDSDVGIDELSPISSRLRAICQVIFLNKIGLDKSLIEKTLTRHYRLHFHFKGDPPDYLGP